MSDRDPMSGTHDCGGDAAAYALGALEPKEAEAFRVHLQECAVCRDELDALGGVVQSLPVAVAQYEAPRGLRRRVMHEVRLDQAGPAHAETGRRRLERSLERGRNRLLAGAAAVTVAAAGVFAALEITAGTAATVITAQLSGISGSAQVRVTGDHGELVVRNLTPPGRGHVYEVWLESGSAAPVPASVLFGVNSAGNAEVGIPSTLHGVSAVLVTPEPYGGSPKPTHTPVITAKLD
jgi:anti-sigma-K factor RskA